MKKKILIPGAALAIYIVTVLSCTQSESEPMKLSATDTISKDSLIRYGGYLVTISGCNDCHSPKKLGPNGMELDQDRLLSGFQESTPIPEFPVAEIGKGYVVVNNDMTCAMGPWGTTFSANITSDPTGIGSWTYTRFETALKHGKYRGLENTRPLMPPMPTQNLSILKDRDIEAIFAYLKSTKPVSNVVPAFRPLEK